MLVALATISVAILSPLLSNVCKNQAMEVVRSCFKNVLRMPSHKNPKIALTWAPEGKRSRGRPRETWRRTVNKEREHLGFKTWSQAEVAARDRVAWRRKINGPILHVERRDR